MRKNAVGAELRTWKKQSQVYSQKRPRNLSRNVAENESKGIPSGVVDFLENPGKYTTSEQASESALLVVPPGTGKTLLANSCWLASAHVPLLRDFRSDFVEMFGGVVLPVSVSFSRGEENSPLQHFH